jgi:23S rRNA (uracil1939-C5)-methyltransferase
VQAARRNAAQRGITNGEFLMGEVEVHWPETLQRFQAGRTAVILDPPRTGCSAATLDWLRQSRPAQIIYVSCKPDTLARDLNILCSEEVFEVSGVVPLDMFPQTQHVECVADLRSKASAAQPR